MQTPTQAQINAALRYAGTAAGTIGTIAALVGVTDQQTAQNIVAALHAVIDDLTQLFGDLSKLTLLVIPVVTIWLAKIGYNSASPQSQVAAAVKIEPKTMIAAVQAIPQAQVTVSDPKLAEGITGVKVGPVQTTVKALVLFAILLGALALTPSANAEVLKVAPKAEPAIASGLPCLQPLDPRPSCKNGIFAPSGILATAGDAAATATQQNPTCDFGTFQVITPQNLVGILQACGQKLVNDSQAALDSATAAKDTTAISCLTPGTALFKAGIGTPATPGTPEVPANPGNPSATPPIPATPEIPAVAAVPAQLGGPILLFQKYREFVNAGGISACESWVNTVVAAQVGTAAGVAGAAIGAAAILPVK